MIFKVCYYLFLNKIILITSATQSRCQSLPHAPSRASNSPTCEIHVCAYKTIFQLFLGQDPSFATIFTSHHQTPLHAKNLTFQHLWVITLRRFLHFYQSSAHHVRETIKNNQLQHRACAVCWNKGCFTSIPLKFWW